MSLLTPFPDLTHRPAKSPARASTRSAWPTALTILIPLFVTMAILAPASLTLTGIVYVIAVITISFFQPHVALMLAFALAPFVQELPIPGPVKISIGEFTLMLCIPAFLITGALRIRFPLFLFLTLLYLGACVFSIIANADRAGLVPLAQMTLYLVVTVLIFSSFVRDPGKLVFILEGSLAVTCFLALLTYTPIAGMLHLHKNALGASMSIGLIIATELWFASTKSATRKRWLTVAILLLSATLLYSLSRGAWMAAVAGIFIVIALRRQFKLLLRLSLLLIPLVAILFFLLPKEQREYATQFNRDRVNINARWQTIDDAKVEFQKSPTYGTGISYRKQIDATNVVLITLAESGLIGLGAFALMHLGVLRSVWKTQKRIPRSHALYSPVALGGALVISRLAHGLVDHYWSRGPILQAWAAAGMSAAVFYALATRRKRRKAPEAFPDFAAMGSNIPTARPFGETLNNN